MNPAGSPLVARENPQVYLVILYLFIAIAIIFSIYIVLQIIKKIHSTPEYIELQKTKVTVYKNVTALAKKLQLTKEQTFLLWKLCKYTKALNIFYTYADIDYVDELFKTYYKHKIRHSAPYEVIYEILKIRFIIYKNITFTRSVQNSKYFPIGTILSYPAPSGFYYQFKIERNEKEGLYLSIPEALEETSNDKPNKLQKIAFVFTVESNQQYAFTTRIIQYITLDDGKKYILVNHSNTICPQSRRTSQRFTVNRECTFSAVDVTDNEDGSQVFSAKPTSHLGTIVDISEGGCKLFTDLPIKKNQYIFLKFEINKQQESLYGIIVDTKKDLDTGFYSLHIAFKNYSLKTKVKLLTDLYNYND